MIPTCEETKRQFRPLSRKLNEQDVLHIAVGENGKFIIDRYSIDNGNRYGCSYALSDAVTRLPEQQPIRQLTAYQPAQAPATDITVELLQHLAGDCIEFEDETAEQLWNTILMRSKHADYAATVMAEYKQNKVVPYHNYELHHEHPLSPYQQTALCVQRCSQGFGLFMEPGTGKTPVMIASICNAAVEKRATLTAQGKAGQSGAPAPYTVVIVAPNSVRSNWLAEFQTFATQCGRVTILRGTVLDRVKLLCDAIEPDPTGEILYTVVICGYATLWRTWEALGRMEWDLAILDEAQAIKDPKSKQAQQALQLRDNSAQRVVLTGTPIGNSVMDMYMQLEFMEEWGSGFSNFAQFKRFYGVYEKRGEHTTLVGCQNLPFLQERLARKSFYISKKEALPDLPDKLYDVCEVDMTEQQQEVYTKIATELAIEIEKQLASDLERSMVINNILTQLLRLAQVTSGFVSWSKVLDPDTGDVLQDAHLEYFYPCPKQMKVAEDIINLDANEKAIIWCCFRPDIDYLASTLEANGVKFVTFHGGMDDSEREAAIYTFNHDRDCKVFVGTAASGGAGLNLLGYPPGRADEFDTDVTLIGYYSENWSQIQRSQSEDRGHRRGTRRPVTIRTYCVPNSIDEVIYHRVMDKKQIGLEVGDLRNIMEAISKVGKDE